LAYDLGREAIKEVERNSGFRVKTISVKLGKEEEQINNE